MKLFIKLGIVFGALFTLIACQKDELALPTGTAIDHTQSEVFQGDVAIDQGEVSWGSTGTEAAQLPGSIWESPTNWGPDSDPTYLDESVEGLIANTGDDHLQSASSQLEAKLAEDWEKTVTIEWVDEMPTDERWIFIDTAVRGRADWGPVPECPYEDCDTAIPAIIAQYQPIANQQCRDIWVCIPCCIDDSIVYATLVISHNCGIVITPVAKE